MFKYIALLALFVAVASSASVNDSQYSIEMKFEKLEDWKALNANFKGKAGYKVHTVQVYPKVIATVFVRGPVMQNVVSYINTHKIQYTIKALPSIPQVV